MKQKRYPGILTARLKVFFVVAALLPLGACGGGSSSGGGGGSASLESDMSKFLKNPVDAAFFAREASAAGVRKVRRLTREDEERIGVPNICGWADTGGVILINTPITCVGGDAATLIGHEISHFGIGDACREIEEGGDGHGDPFWEYFRGIASRYVANVSGGSWSNPFARIDRNEQSFIDSGTRKCKRPL